MSIHSYIHGKIKATKTLWQFMQNFSNYAENFHLYLNRKPLSILSLKDGMNIHCSQQDDGWALYKEIFIEECYTKNGFYTPKDGDTIIDCGANIGFFSLFMAHSGKQVCIYSLEPSQKTRERLNFNVRSNHLEQKIHVIPHGLSNITSTFKLKTALYAGSSSQFTSGDEYEEIHCKSLPEFMTNENIKHIHFLKMDIEGAEIEVFQGIDEETWKKIDAIALEYHEENRPGCHDILMNTLKKHFKFVESWPISPKGELGIMRAKK